MLIFEQIRTGGDRNFGYLLGDRDAGKAVLVDPSYDPKKLVRRAEAQGLTATESAARAEYESLHQVLLKLPDATTVWPGHDYGCRPSSTIGLEKRTNPFLLCPSIDAFLELKAGWADYKRQHGLV